MTISIHAPRAGGDEKALIDLTVQQAISIHAPRAGGDGRRSMQSNCKGGFQSTPPVRGATARQICEGVSRVISIHAPRAGGDCCKRMIQKKRRKFQSTPPVRGATMRSMLAHQAEQDFNPRPPCGGRPSPYAGDSWAERISIHAPRAGGDPLTALTGSIRLFQSTPPVRGATCQAHSMTPTELPFQSTPPVRGATRVSKAPRARTAHFNPRPPCGGRRLQRRFAAMRKRFQSTPPVRGATQRQYVADKRHTISIHAPRAGGDAYMSATATP